MELCQRPSLTERTRWCLVGVAVGLERLDTSRYILLMVEDYINNSSWHLFPKGWSCIYHCGVDADTINTSKEIHGDIWTQGNLTGILVLIFIMVYWIILPITLSLVSFMGTWSLYGLALSNGHVCPLSDWSGANHCRGNETKNCCVTPTISSSGKFAPENSLFSATLNAGSFLFLLFCIFHHAHVLEKHTCHSMLSKFALAFGVVSAFGSFVAGNCNADTLTLLHFLGAGVSFVCISFYAVLLTDLTRKCDLTGYEKVLYPLRITSTVIQVLATICYAFFYIQNSYFYNQLSAVFEWMLTMNMELFELSYVVEFSFFSTFMLSNLLSRREEEKPLMMT